jgi:hypothetical protein
MDENSRKKKFCQSKIWVTKVFASFVAAQSDLEDAEKWCWSFRKVFWKRAPPTVEKLSF